MYSTTKIRLALNCTACRKRRISGWPASWAQTALMRSHHDSCRQGRLVLLSKIERVRLARAMCSGTGLTLHVSEAQVMQESV